MEHAVADGVSDARIMEVLVPLRGRKLAGNDGGACAAAIIEEFEQIVALGIGERRESEIVQDEDVEASEFAEGADVSAVGTSQGELVEEPRGRMRRASVASVESWRSSGGMEAAQEPGHLSRLLEWVR